MAQPVNRRHHVLLRTSRGYMDKPIVDGVPLDNVVSARIDVSAMEPPEVTLVLHSGFDFAGDATVRHEHACGCTPPNDDLLDTVAGTD